ncbi:ABC transporter ATP-binding protein [Eubacterium oxidoreducens]|uniref:Iron complex transport system ATP-binding protein n=1 Tax=Eubacterium oxidoreducens TaxID=1732 RepID=A0A1G6BNZ9_EUBOX|nr:ABC transporter ATP-binding protein [Eubacterium oxidoreducens]SDB22350.1 iron complex transport system ATP-binding protein [Eubacterium oxidoreducens]
MLELIDVSCGYKGTKKSNRVVLEHVNLTMQEGEIWCILGHNGVGKTTLYKTILGLLPAMGGEILLDQENAFEMSRTELAKKIAYVPQYHTPPFSFRVIDVVLMGRNVYVSAFGTPSKEDEAIAEHALKMLGILHLKDRIYTRISGGERQMVLIARAIAQQPKFLMMDEPAANLDYGNQVRMLRQMKELSNQGIGIMFTSHHPEHAFYCDANVAAVISENEIMTGTSDEIINEELLYKIYGIDSALIEKTQSQHTYKAIVPIV